MTSSPMFSSSKSSSSSNLAGKTILLTRPVNTSACLLQETLRAVGAEVPWIPLIEVVEVPFALPAQWQEADWWLFTSQNAVSAFLKILDLPSPSALQSRIAAVGNKTSLAVREAGYPVHLVPEHFDALSALQAIIRTSCKPELAAGHSALSVLWPCGNLANPQLQVAAIQANIHLMPVTVYDTRPKPPDNPALGELARLLPSLDMIVFTSPSAVNAYADWRLTAPSDTASLRPAIACIGPSTAIQALERLQQADIIAEPHTLEALAQQIQAYYANRP